MTGSELTQIAAFAALAIGLIALVVGVWTGLWVRRVRSAQRALLAGENVDLVEFAVGMQARMEHVERLVEELREELVATGKRADRALQRRAIVRYDALKDIGGHQSSSIALLDLEGNGVVLSAIQGRDYARIYVRDVVAGGPGSIELTPEEQAAVRRALEV